MSMTSNRPYFIRALYEWISDNQLTPHLLVNATLPGVAVPEQFVKDGKIVLNIDNEAIANLTMTNDWVIFDARFSGVSHQIRLPVLSIEAMYAVENGQGMVFEPESGDEPPPPPELESKDTSKKSGRPSLKIVK